MCDHRLGEIQPDTAAGDPHLDPLRHKPAAITLRASAVAVDANDILRFRGRGARDLAADGRQVPGQNGKLTVGARSQRPLQPVVEFFRGQPAITRGHPQQFDYPVPILV